MIKRYNVLDCIRGFALINMIIYHALWDVVYIFDVNISWYKNLPGYIWQQFICHTFILLSGFCFCFGGKKLKRGLTIVGVSLVITVATCIFMPKSKIIFGVLTLLGCSSLLLTPFEKTLKKINPYVGFCVFLALFAATKGIPQGHFEFGNILTAFIGFPPREFFSSDYFPLIPWLFLFVSGFYMYLIFKKHSLLESLGRATIKPLEFMGRHSLIIYMLHQPIIYGVLLMIFEVIV